MSNKISIIILNWNQEADTAACLNFLQKLAYDDYRVILVDNGSEDQSPDAIEERFPSVKVIRNRANLGFAEGNNVGIRAALRDGADHVLLLNNDTTVEPDFLRLLIEAMKNDRAIGIASPKIMFFSERNRLWFAGGYYLAFINKPSHRFYGQIDAGQVKNPAETDWVSGCCMLIKREVFEKIGFLDDDYFLYNEDVDFCARAKEAGYTIVVVPAARIYHKFAASMGGSSRL